MNTHGPDCLACQTAGETSGMLRARAAMLEHAAALNEALQRMHMSGRGDGIPAMTSLHSAAWDVCEKGIIEEALLEAARGLDG